MNTLTRLRRHFRAGVVVAALMLAAAGGLVTVREGQYDRLTEEYAATRAAAALLEQFAAAGTLEQLPDGVEGFGVYDVDGAAIAAFGSAPAVIILPDAGETSERTNGTLRLVRTIGLGRGAGSGLGLATTGSHPQATETGADGTQRGYRRLGGTGSYLLIDYDVSSAIRHTTWQHAALIASGTLTAAALALLVMLYRRLQGATQEAAEQSRLARLGEAARTLAHEIRNPLTAAQMQSALLRRSVEASQLSRIDIIDEELARIRALTDQIREFLRTGAGRATPIAVLPAVREIASRLSIPIETSGSDETRVLFDAERFQSVASNLLRNAVEADQSGSPISVTLRSERRRVRLEIADRGPGIPAAERTRVFDPFYSTKTQGSGVGLAITRRFVEESGGTISIEDRPGGGALIIVELRGMEHESTDRR